MSRRRLVTGVDARGRPTSTWADPEPADAPRYGHMEPAMASPIERRRLTATELDAVRARDATARPHPRRGPAAVPLVSDADRMAASRARGAQRHVQVIAARRPAPAPSEEEPAMADEAPPTDTDVEDPAPEPVALEAALEVLASRATAAAGAWSDKVAAEQSWEVAQAALEDAWATVGLGQQLDAGQRHLQALGELVDVAERAIDAGLEEAVAAAAADGETQVSPVSEPSTNIPRTIPEPEPARSNGVGSDDLSRLSRRQREIVEAVRAHGGARRPVADQLRTSIGNIEATLENVGKRGLLPADLIPLLPARFAKYSTVRA